MAYYSDIVVDDQTSAPRAGVSITVLKNDGTRAALTDAVGAAITQPLVTNDSGFFSFYVTDNIYTLEYRYAGRLVQRDKITIGYPPEDGGFKNTGIRNEDGPFTLRQRVNPCYICHIGNITAERIITLSADGARDGDTWHIYRNSTGPFNLIVLGVEGHFLTAPDKWVTFRYFEDVNQIRRIAYNP